MVDALVGRLDRQPEQAGIHYLLLDACVTFLNWPALFPSPPGGAGGGAAQLLRYLVGLPALSPTWARVHAGFGRLLSVSEGCTVAGRHLTAHLALRCPCMSYSAHA